MFSQIGKYLGTQISSDLNLLFGYSFLANAHPKLRYLYKLLSHINILMMFIKASNLVSVV